MLLTSEVLSWAEYHKSSTIFFQLILPAQITPFVKWKSDYVTNMELISPMGFLAPFAPDAVSKLSALVAHLNQNKLWNCYCAV